MHQEIIIHHYAVSPYAEKIRRILAYKKVPWRSVEQPITMPKPFLTSLTGGYRRIPVMQIGADIYCDSACIALRLEALFPESPVIPPQLTHLVSIIQDWADHHFVWRALAPSFVDLSSQLPADILEDRAKMSPRLTVDSFMTDAPHALTQALQSMRHLDGMLAGRRFLLDDRFTLADASCYLVLFIMAQSARVFEPAIATFPDLKAWYERVGALGAVISSLMSREEALAVATAARPIDLEGGIGDIYVTAMSEALRIGDRIAVVPDDYGDEQVQGKLARVTGDTLTVLRADPDLGEIAVHFPRLGYRVNRL